MNDMTIDLLDIIKNGYCIGCGACSVMEPDAINIHMNTYGQYEAKILSNQFDNNILNICPFSDASINEDELSHDLFKKNTKKNQYIGYYKSLYVGYVKEKNYREKATSGGMISWVLCELLEKDLIDYVIHVKENKNNKDILFKYTISSSRTEIMDGAKSRYYPVEISEVMKLVKQNPGRYVFVGLPCFVKSVRLLMREDSVLNDRIKYCIGLVCGHLKSKEFSNFFAWQAGIQPDTLKKIDFRVKLDNNNAGNYGVSLKGSNNTEVIKPVQSFFGFNWRNNFFRYSACNYCDDVFAETADMVVGDAWLPEYMTDTKGTSVVVVRNNELAQIIDHGGKDKKLNLEIVTENQIIDSQSGGIRDRREGLSYRLFLKQNLNQWVPRKRVEANSNINAKRKKIYSLRLKMEELSHIVWKEAMDENSYDLFENKLAKYVKQAENYYKLSISQRIIQLFIKTVKNPIKMSKKITNRIYTLNTTKKYGSTK